MGAMSDHRSSQLKRSRITSTRSQDTATQGNGSRPMRSESFGSPGEAIAALKSRLRRGIPTDQYSCVKALQMCLKRKDFSAAKELHDFFIECGMEKNPYVANNLLDFYIKSGGLLDARQVFDQLEQKSVVTWNMMIAGYAKDVDAESALELFILMRQNGVRPNEVTFLSALKACASPLALQWGKEVHVCVRHAGFESDVRIGNSLIQMYAKCGCMTEARRVFEKMSDRNFISWTVMIGVYAASGNADDARLIFDRMKQRDLFTWNVMIGAYAEKGRGLEAYRLFLQMRREGFEPDAFTYMTILNPCALNPEPLSPSPQTLNPETMEWVNEVHGQARKAGLESDLRVGNALIQMYTKCGRIAEAMGVFEKMSNRNFITWSMMIGAYAASGNLDDARVMFNRMKRRDLITWNLMIGAYAERGRGGEAYQLFVQMKQEGFEPDAITYLSILNPCASAGALEWVKKVHGHARSTGLETDVRVGNALVHMYAQSGSIDDARLVFDRMKTRNVITWTAMLGGLAQHGCGHEALELFRKMNADLVMPNSTTFVALLSACVHAGLVDDGRRLFSAMTQDYGIEPDIVHYTCMVDLLGRAGHLEEAKRFISDMPVEPNGVTWGALLGACRIHGDVELGELAAEELLKLEPNNAGAYVLLSNIYAAAGKWDKVSSVRSLMQNRGVRKQPGRTWIEVDNKIHEFVVGDTSHPEAKAIHTYIRELTEKLKAEGYIPDTQLMNIRNINEEDKELALCSHSEKLAIAYGLMRIPPGELIHIRKNLRVCPDCHTATKFISRVTGREIIARDANRYHHFKDGVCSCGDYW